MPTEDSIRKAQKIFNDMTDPQNLIKGISYAKQLEEDFVRTVELQKLRENQRNKEKIEITPTQLAREIAGDMKDSERGIAAESPESNGYTPYTTNNMLNPHNPKAEELYSIYGNEAIENSREQNSDNEHTR